MTIEPASTALNRFTILDLTRVRTGPTCVRQLVHRIALINEAGVV